MRKLLWGSLVAGVLLLASYGIRRSSRPATRAERDRRAIAVLTREGEEVVRDFYSKNQQTVERAVRRMEEIEQELAQIRAGDNGTVATGIDQGDVLGLRASFDAAMKPEPEARAELDRHAPLFTDQWKMPKSVKYLERIETPLRHGEAVEALALSSTERATLRKQGFVVTERLGSTSPAELMLRTYQHDQPIFISADAVLHAWHMTQEAILISLEESVLSPSLQRMLDSMSTKLREQERQSVRGPLGQSVEDVGVYLDVARALLRGSVDDQAPFAARRRTHAILAAIEGQREATIDLFGHSRTEDFSQLRPRGHYQSVEALRRYFRAMMWLERTTLELAGPPGTEEELRSALLLHDLLIESGQRSTWVDIDSLLRVFVGPSTTSSPLDLESFLVSAGLKLGAELESEQGLAAFRARLAQADLPRVGEPPRFSFIGQRFALDAWVLAQVTAPLLPPVPDAQRLIPSGVDVAFAALANDNVAALLMRRMSDPQGVHLRDGLPFHASVLAARTAIDALPQTAWEGTLYGLWLRALRGLSTPTTGAQFPAVMRSEAWSMRVLQAQLASWAELRHDAILYVEQSGRRVTCEYPAGFVELAPEFWASMERAAVLGADALRRLPQPPLAAMRHLESFAATMKTLRGIVVKELASAPLSIDESEFLRGTIISSHRAGTCAGPTVFDGWFPALYFKPVDQSASTAVVADVHNVPQVPRVHRGGVLHAATGPVSLMVVIIERGEQAMAFAGPVSSYFEFEAPLETRLNDHEWQRLLREAPPARPEWTQGWLVKGRLAVPEY